MFMLLGLIAVGIIAYHTVRLKTADPGFAPGLLGGPVVQQTIAGVVSHFRTVSSTYGSTGGWPWWHRNHFARHPVPGGRPSGHDGSYHQPGQW